MDVTIVGQQHHHHNHQQKTIEKKEKLVPICAAMTLPKGPQQEGAVWLAKNFVVSDKNSSITKSKVYKLYLAYCQRRNLEALVPCVFGRLVHKVFDGIRTTRRNRGKRSKYHYLHLSKRSGFKSEATETTQQPQQQHFTPQHTATTQHTTTTTTSTTPPNSTGSSLSSSPEPHPSPKATNSPNGSFSYASASDSLFSAFSASASDSLFATSSSSSSASSSVSRFLHVQREVDALPFYHMEMDLLSFESQSEPSTLLELFNWLPPEVPEKVKTTTKTSVTKNSDSNVFQIVRQAWASVYRQIGKALDSSDASNSTFANLGKIWSTAFKDLGLASYLSSESGRVMLLQTERMEIEEFLASRLYDLTSLNNEALRFFPIWIQSATLKVVDVEFLCLHGRMVEDCLRNIQS